MYDNASFCPHRASAPSTVYSIIFSLVILSLFVFTARGFAQTPPEATSGVGAPNMYVLHAKDWPTGGTSSLPQPFISRTNAGERWYNIEIARGTFCDTGAAGTYNSTDCETASSGYSYTHLGNLYAYGTSLGWIPVANVNGGASYKAALMYTFNTVPGWASGNTSSPSSSTANPPTDVTSNGTYTPETCTGVLAGYTSQKGDCYFKEYVTYLMRSLCHISHAPGTPLTNSCDIRYFEGWNEFNGDGFWTGNYKQLAQMMADADEIVHQYCGDCYFMAGSVSAGGDSYHANGETGIYANALGELLDDWHAYDSTLVPDMLSFHAYPSHDNIFPIPMPETNLPDTGFTTVPSGMTSSYSSTNYGCQSGNSNVTGNPVYPEPAAAHSLACRDSVLNMVPEMRLVVQHESGWLASNTPVWNTESSWGANGALDFGTQTNAYDPAEDNSLTDTERQAYIARASILLASGGALANLWYQMDNASFGTLVSYDSAGDPSSAANNPAAIAFNRVYGWLLGATFTGSPVCSGANGIWTCPITKADGTHAVIAWYTPTNHAPAVFAMPSGLSYIHDMDGNTIARPAGQNLNLYNRPTLLDTSSEQE